jgi:hypothetical protein
MAASWIAAPVIEKPDRSNLVRLPHLGRLSCTTTARFGGLLFVVSKKTDAGDVFQFAVPCQRMNDWVYLIIVLGVGKPSQFGDESHQPWSAPWQMHKADIGLIGSGPFQLAD